MIPVNLRLRNFLSYGNEVPPLDFSGFQLACLSGNNGHGKSSLLDAITWAIWGEARKTSNARTPDEGLLHLGARQPEMEVELEFNLEADRYRVLRKFAKQGKKTNSLLEFQVWDQAQDCYRSLTGNSKALTQQKIDQILRMDYETFINSAFILQGRADEFTKKAARQRKEILANILGLSRYDELSELARAHVRKAKGDWRELQGKLEAKELEVAKKEEYEQQLAELAEAIQKLQRELAQQEKNLNQNHKKKLNLEAQQQREKELTARWEQLSHDQRQNQAQIGKLEEKLASYTHILQQADSIRQAHQQYLEAWNKDQEMEKLRQQESQLQEKLRQCQGQIEQARHELNTELQVAKAKQEELNKSREKLPALRKKEQELQLKLKQYQEHKTQLDEVTKQGQGLKEALLKQEHELDSLKKFEQECQEKRHLLLESQTANCPLCASQLDAEKKQQLVTKLAGQIEENGAKIQTLERELEQSGRQREKLRQEFAALQQQLGGFEAIQQEAAQMAVAIRESEAAQKELAEVSGRCCQLEQRLRDGDYAIAQQQEVAGLQTGLKKLGYQPQEHDGLRQQLQALKDAPRRWEQLQNVQENCQDSKAMLEQSQMKEQQLEAKKAELQKQLQEVKQQQQQLPALIVQVEQQEAAYKIQKQRYEQLIHEQGAYKSKLEYCLKLTREIKDLQEKSRQLEYERGIYEKLAVAFGRDGIQSLIIENVIPELEEEANQILGPLTNNTTQVSIEALRDKKIGGQQETLDIQISDELGTRSYELYSGGEGFRINFALRIALSKLLARRAGTRLRTLVIDEGFGTQDSEGLENLIDAIGVIKNDFDKIIVVTHLEAVKEAFPVTIRVSKTPQDGSSFEIIS